MMEDNDSPALADFAGEISTKVREAATLTQNAMNAGKSQDHNLELLLGDLSCFADECEYLSRQVGGTTKLHVGRFVNDDQRERF